MATRQYCTDMARYNVWQNSQLAGFLEALEPEQVTGDCGGYFGSILGTLNHLLWGDAVWTARFDHGEDFGVGIEEGTALCGDLAAWKEARDGLDVRITRWADGVSDAALQGDLAYYSWVAQRELSKPMGLCVMQLFNHQTHHRGQVHTMLTAMGSQAPVSDLPFMPD